jgi:hypothetical protein
MKPLVRQLFLLALTLNFVWPQSVLAGEGSEGPGSGGGGGVIAIESKYYLIDFLNIMTLEELLKISTKPGDFQKQASKREFTLKRNSEIQNSSFKKAQDIFAKWQSLPFGLGAPLMDGGFYEPLRWSFVDGLNKTAKYFNPQFLPSEAKVATAAYYTNYGRANFTINIERSIWNQMSEMNQVGLIVHEGLRNLQFITLGSFDDEALQKVTAILILCKPSIKLSQYMMLLTLNQPALAEQRMGSFESVTAHCDGSL